MRLAVISGHRPILLNRRVRWHSHTVGLAPVKRIAVFVFDGDEVELTGSKTLEGNEDVGIREPPRINRVPVRVIKSRL